MVTKIHIVTSDSLSKVISSNEIKDGKINVRHYDDDGDGYYTESIAVSIKETFLVIINAQFIRNDDDKSNLNAYTMFSGFGQINSLAYSYSVIIVNTNSTNGKLYQSDCIYTDSGIASTKFDMYSYHVNEPHQKYLDYRLEHEVFDSLDFNKIFGKYLTTSDIRDNKITNLLNDF
jgi:hypothetical protein